MNMKSNTSPWIGAPDCVQINLAIAAEAERDWGRALELWVSVAREQPISAEPLKRIAIVLLLLDELDDSIKFFKASLELAPNDAFTWSYLGLAQRLSGQNDLSYMAYEAAYELAPSEESIGLELARLLVSSGQTENALRVLQHISTLRAENVEVGQLEATAHMIAGDMGAALMVARLTAEHFPADAASQALVGSILHSIGQLDGARSQYKHSLSLDPESFEAKLGLMLMDSSGQSLYQHLEELKETSPTRIETYFLLGWLAMLRDDMAAANDYALAGLGLRPGDTGFLFIHSMALCAENRSDEAFVLFECIANLNPDHVLAKLALAHMQVAAGGDLTAAREILEDVVSRSQGTAIADQAKSLLRQLHRSG